MDLLIGLVFLGIIVVVIVAVPLTMIFSRSNNLRRHSELRQRRRRHGAPIHRGHDNVTWGTDTSFNCSWSGAQGGDGQSGGGYSSSSCSSSSCGGGGGGGGGGN